MKKLLTLVAVVAGVVAIGVSAAAAKPAKQATTVTIAMHDPGCHWFLTGGKYTKTLTVAGPVKVLNVDEAALMVMGHGMKTIKVGHLLPLGKGVYHITMIGQAPDDNHLVLTVK